MSWCCHIGSRSEFAAICIRKPGDTELRGRLHNLCRTAGLQEHRAGRCKEMPLRCHEGSRRLAERNPFVRSNTRRTCRTTSLARKCSAATWKVQSVAASGRRGVCRRRASRPPFARLCTDGADRATSVASKTLATALSIRDVRTRPALAGCWRRLPPGCWRRLPSGYWRRLPPGCWRRLWHRDCAGHWQSHRPGASRASPAVCVSRRTRSGQRALIDAAIDARGACHLLTICAPRVSEADAIVAIIRIDRGICDGEAIKLGRP